MDPAFPRKPMTMTELMPYLGGFFSKDPKSTYTEKKEPRPAVVTRTNEKVNKPMSSAEMRGFIQALTTKSPKRIGQGATSGKKRWNSSVKVDKKTISHTANGQLNHNPVRKVLNFQQPKPLPKTSTSSNARMTMNTGTSKFTKPETKAKKSLHPQVNNAVRISGVYQMPETPLINNKPIKNRMTLANKENMSNHSTITRKMAATPKSCLRKRIMASRIPDTPLSNVSWKSSCDSSFLQHEKDTEFVESKTGALKEEQTLEDIPERSLPASTPFKEYRNVKEFFNNSSDLLENSNNDNTVMIFDKTSINNENSKREESVIVSLCDMLNKATVSSSNTVKPSTELDNLIEIARQMEEMQKLQLKSLQYVRKLIYEKEQASHEDKTVIETTKDIPKIKLDAPPVKSRVTESSSSIIKSCLKSPSYKIPKKNMSCLRKKVYYKSMPNVSNVLTPPKDMGDRALSMYLKMKEHMNFLSTPLAKQKNMEVPDTPAITSHNLQKQLDKLYDED